MDFKNKNVLVCGIAKSGIAAAFLLNKLKADVTIQDLKERNNFEDDAKKLENIGVKLYFGKNPDDIVKFQDFIIVSPGIPSDLDFILEAKKIGIPVWSEIELAYKVCKAPIVGITGTNGKTTTTSLVGEIFNNFNKNTKVVGNIGIPFSGEVLNINKNGYVIAELSSFQLENIESFKPKISAVLNITPDHLNRHKTIENYISAKERIFENQDENDFVILNYDDLNCRKMAEKTKSKIIYFSRKEAIANGVYADEKSIYINYRNYNQKVIDIQQMNILGSHNVENAMAAIAISICADIDINIIIKSLKEFKAVEHRIEYVTTINNIEFYNDSKGTNPDAAIKSIEAMKRPIILIGGGYDKGSDFNKWIESFNGKVKLLVVIGAVSDKIIETAKEHNFTNFKKANSLKEAVNICFENASQGDCILLSPACASWDMFENYEQRGKMFKEFVFNLEKVS